ncbi:aromatic amino acid hydroxylase [Daejeonella lutea]|uniref:Phenylalanine-4-hydroxylase n=1 Tax=Daejeonella lutea TaxID=572036 RepID=A0A1T4ZXU2_9SPHI|nr:aromatic amino acid hydroxylase [Daejeonella lutea]SKB27631.1 phenylalanine-4-hydroxylase [Daejeonella lutea]
MAGFNDFNNPQVKQLPNHLRQFIVEQHYEHYTPVDHAVWRYVMRQNYSYLKDIAYYPYIPGLEAAGLTIEKVPDLQEMNNALAKIGWGAVTVDGFIPPSAFMEYQSYRVLVIAADIRQLHHIEYTPAPDIIHESAGHAPIIADKDYHEYLSYFGSIGAKAMFSSKDFELYEAIRELSILKEMHDADPGLLRKAEKRVDFCQKNLGEPSEMALLSRLHWWTVEYGLIGTLDDPKIYGAGLLSSIGESTSCMTPEVKKHWYTLDAINYPFDITKPQPQLFVTPDFQNLINVLEQFADTMAFRRGGSEGILKAIECKNVCTATYSSGIQVSGIFTDMGMNSSDELQFIKTTGPSALSFENKQLDGHDKKYHSHGFSSPVGRLKNLNLGLEDASEENLQSLGIMINETATLQFTSGLTVSGLVQSINRKKGKIILITFSDCTVKDEQGNIFFEPSWGVYDMAVGEKIVSAYCGAADKDSFEEAAPVSKTATHHSEYDIETIKYHELFRKVRNCREHHSNYEDLLFVWKEIQDNYREDWLCSMEILEILEHENIHKATAREIRIYLEMKASNEHTLTKLIHDGFHLIKNPVTQLTN